MMKCINVSDKMRGCESSPLSCGRWIVIGRLRWSQVVYIIKRIRNARRWIVIGRSWCVFCRFNLDRYNSSWLTVEIKTWSGEPDLATYPSSLKWRSTVEIPRAIEHFSRCHIASSSRSLIAIWSDCFDSATSPAWFKKFRKIYFN